MEGISKNTLYTQINEHYKNPKIFPLYISKKIFKAPKGESGIHEYANRSIYILSSPCNKRCCDRECKKAVEILNTEEIGQNLLQNLVDKGSKSCYIRKCIVYKFP